MASSSRQMLFEAIVQTSQQVASTRSRLTKVGLLSEAIRSLEPAEIDSGVAFLSGEIRQGRLGIGYARVRDLAQLAPATTATLTVADVDLAFEALAGAGGRGSNSERDRLLGALFARATSAEQNFLGR